MMAFPSVKSLFQQRYSKGKTIFLPEIIRAKDEGSAGPSAIAHHYTVKYKALPHNLRIFYILSEVIKNT